MCDRVEGVESRRTVSSDYARVVGKSTDFAVSVCFDRRKNAARGCINGNSLASSAEYPSAERLPAPLGIGSLVLIDLAASAARLENFQTQAHRPVRGATCGESGCPSLGREIAGYEVRPTAEPMDRILR